MNNKIRITFISDTHTKERQLNLPGGNILIHSGDFMNSGYDPNDAYDFFNWLESLDNYDHKIFIAGNHDRWMQNKSEEAKGILTGYKTIDYLEDEELVLSLDGTDGDTISIYGSPWQPEFYNWAFNLPRNGEQLENKWKAIPGDTDILITHGPPQGHLDTSGPPYNEPLLGCELLRARVDEIKPKIHVFGHIHGGYGTKEHNETLFINASVLNERYIHTNPPISILFDTATKKIEII